MKKLIAAAVCALALTAGAYALPAGMYNAFSAYAAAEETEVIEEPLFETAVDDEGNVTIVKYLGEGGDVTVPAQLDGGDVVSVAAGAFYECEGITSVTFESDVTVPEEGSVGFAAEGVKAEGLTVICGYSSAARTYAEQNGFAVIINDYISITGAKVTLSATSYTYNGSAKKPGVTLLLDGKVVAPANYAVTYSANTNAGTAKVTIKGKGQYTGSVSTTFTIAKAKLGTATLSTQYYTYTGSAFKPAVTVKSGSKTLVKGTDYTVTYADNKAVGTATATVTGKGNYTGSIKSKFYIRLSDVTGIKGSSASATSVTLKWTKVKGAAGYRVYITDSDGKVTKKADVTTNSATVKKLAAGTKYKFSVRAYVTEDGTTRLSPDHKYKTLSTAPATVSYTIKTTEKGKAALSWSKVKGATSYAVFYKQNLSDKWTRLADLSISRTSYTVTGLSGAKGGYVTVKAYIKYGGVTNGGAFERKAVYKYQRAAARLDAYGWDIRKAFTASVVPWIGRGLPRNGTTTMEWYAEYGFTHGYGHCFCMAAMFTEMAKTMGYDCRQVYGAVGTSPHSWARLTLNGVSYICDPDFTTETGRNGYCITYGTPGTWRYTTYGYVATNG